MTDTDTLPGGDGPCPQECTHPVAGDQTLEYRERSRRIDPPRFVDHHGTTVRITSRMDRFWKCIVCGWRVDV